MAPDTAPKAGQDRIPTTAALTERDVKHGHTTWRVYCRWDPRTQTSNIIPCQEYPLPRLNRKAAADAAREHTRLTGHPSEVVRLRFDSVLEVSNV